MPWTEPTLQERRDRVRQDFFTRMGAGDAPLRRSVENVYSYIIAAAAHGLGGYVSWVAKQIIPSEDSDLDSILRWANNFLAVPQTPAVQAIGSVDVTFTAAATVPTGYTFTSRDGIAYTVDSDIVATGAGTKTGAITAAEAGADGNIEAGVALFIGTPVANVNDEAIASTGGVTAGANEEDKFSVLERLRQRFQTPPRGGSAGDFAAWALEISSVSRAYEFPQDPSTGWVTVLIVDDVSGPVPGAQTISDAQDNVDLKRPIMMGGATVIGPTPVVLALIWSGLVPAGGDDIAAAKVKLEANVESWVLAQPPGTVLSQPAIEDAGQAVVNTVSLAYPVVDQDPGTYGMYTTFNHFYT